jgi:hypothetical protein
MPSWTVRLYILEDLAIILIIHSRWTTILIHFLYLIDMRTRYSRGHRAAQMWSRALFEAKVLFYPLMYFFSKDSAAALWANELHMDAIVKATNFDGVSGKGPKVHRDAVEFDKI